MKFWTHPKTWSPNRARASVVIGALAVLAGLWVLTPRPNTTTNQAIANAFDDANKMALEIAKGISPGFEEAFRRIALNKIDVDKVNAKVEMVGARMKAIEDQPKLDVEKLGERLKEEVLKAIPPQQGVPVSQFRKVESDVAAHTATIDRLVAAIGPSSANAEPAPQTVTDAKAMTRFKELQSTCGVADTAKSGEWWDWVHQASDTQYRRYVSNCNNERKARAAYADENVRPTLASYSGRRGYGRERGLRPCKPGYRRMMVAGAMVCNKHFEFDGGHPKYDQRVRHCVPGSSRVVTRPGPNGTTLRLNQHCSDHFSQETRR